MGIRITINAVVKCKDQKSARIILMEAMKGQLLHYLKPIPETVKTYEDATEWKLRNWGDSLCLNFQSGWIFNKTIIMNLSGGSPSFAYRLLRNCDLVQSVSLNYQGHDDFVSPDFCGLWIDGDQLHFKRDTY
jgi:hypothetical protein